MKKKNLTIRTICGQTDGYTGTLDQEILIRVKNDIKIKQVEELLALLKSITIKGIVYESTLTETKTSNIK